MPTSMLSEPAVIGFTVLLAELCALLRVPVSPAEIYNQARELAGAGLGDGAGRASSPDHTSARHAPQ